MKKHARKLSLNRETLRHLESGEVIRVAGGSANCTSVVCVEYTACECPSMSACNTDCCQETQVLWGCTISADTCRHC